LGWTSEISNESYRDILWSGDQIKIRSLGKRLFLFSTFCGPDISLHKENKDMKPISSRTESKMNLIENGPDQWVLDLFGSSLCEINERKRQKFVQSFVEVGRSSTIFIHLLL
jgi:hypothetical protein